MVVWDIMAYEGPSVGKTLIKTSQICSEKVQKIEARNLQCVMNKIGAQINVNLQHHFLGTSLITLSPLLAWRRSYGIHKNFLSNMYFLGNTETPNPHLSHPMTKPTKWPVCPVKTQISLVIRPVWSESSLCTQWVAKDPNVSSCVQQRLIRLGGWPGWSEPLLGAQHRSFCWFCHAAAHFITSTYKLFEKNINQVFKVVLNFFFLRRLENKNMIFFHLTYTKKSPTIVCVLPNISLLFLIWASSWDYGTYHIGHQRRLRQTCAFAQSHQSLRCSRKWSMEVDQGSDQKSDI